MLREDLPPAWHLPRAGRAGGVDLSTLSIVSGKTCWVVYADALLLNIGGNLHDALSAAAKVRTAWGWPLLAISSSPHTLTAGLPAADAFLCVASAALPQAALADARIPRVQVVPGEDPTGERRKHPHTRTAGAAAASAAFTQRTHPTWSQLPQTSPITRLMTTRRPRSAWTSPPCRSASPCRRHVRARLLCGPLSCARACCWGC